MGLETISGKMQKNKLDEKLVERLEIPWVVLSADLKEMQLADLMASCSEIRSGQKWGEKSEVSLV